MTDDELIDHVAKIIWDTYYLGPKSTWAAGWWSQPFPWVRTRTREIARELISAIREVRTER